MPALIPLMTDAQRYQHWYWTPRWRHRSRAQLKAEPFCRMCLDGGVYVAATVADHIVPHRGDADLFWNGRLQSLCKRHHDVDKKREERSMLPLGCDADGWPLDRAP